MAGRFYLAAFWGFTILMSSFQAMAAVTFLRATGYSQLATSLTTPIIYAGFAENGAACTKDGSTTCDTCVGDITVDNVVEKRLPCNKTSAYPELELTIYFKTDSTDVTNGRIKLFFGEVEIPTTATSTTLGAGLELMASAKWSVICGAFNASDSNCQVAIASKTLKVGIDKDAGGTLDEYLSVTIVTRNVALTGFGFKQYTDCKDGAPTSGGYFCHFELAAGDEKVYLDKMVYGPDEMASEVVGADYSKLIFYYAKNTTNDDNATLLSIKNNSDFKDVVINKGNSPPLDKFYLTGLSNNTRYCFVMANQDLAGNITYFSNSDVFAAQASTMCATPEEVYGALSGKSCFIATAAYGGPMAQEVETFRQFRDRFLLPVKWGRTFVRTYYRWSPPLAEVISKSPILKGLVQVLLLPLLVIAKASLGWGFGKTLLVGLLGLIFIFGKGIFKFFFRGSK